MGLGKLEMFVFGELKNNNVIKIQGPGVGLAASPLLSLLQFFVLKWFIVFSENMGRGGGCLSSFQVHLLIFLGNPFVFIPCIY